MEKDKFKRALEIESELSQLRTLQREIEKKPLFSLYFGATLCVHAGACNAAKEYIYNRIKQLDKEFHEL